MTLRGRMVPVCLATLGLIVIGCSSAASGPKIKGQVLLDGKPLSDARVHFHGKGGNTATTDKDGKFEFTGADPVTGVQPGTYLVLISKFVDAKGNSPDKEDLEQLIASNQAKNVVPAKYSNVEVAPLTAEIKVGVNELKPFELKSK